MALKPLDPQIKLLSLSNDKCLYAKVKPNNEFVGFGTIVDEGNSSLKLYETVAIRLHQCGKFYVMGD